MTHRYVFYIVSSLYGESNRLTEEAKQELEEAGDDVADYIVQTASKTQKTIANFTKTASNPLGVDVLDANGNLRDTYDILLDIAKVYKEIQADDKKYGTNRAQGLVEFIAGKNRSNIAASILQNPELLENVYETALNSSGSAMEENEKYLDSISGKLQQLTNAGQEFATNFLDSELVKNITDILTAITQLGSKGVSSFNALQIAATGFMAVMGYKNLNLKNIGSTFKEDKQQFGFFGAVGNQLGFGQHKRDVQSFNQFKSAYGQEMNNVNGPVSQAVMYKLAEENMKNASSAARQLAKDVAAGKKTFDEAGTSLANMGLKAKVLNGSMKILGGLLSGLVTGFISMAIGALFSWIDDLIHAEEKTHEAAVKLKEDLKTLNSNASKNQTEFRELAERYHELADGVDAYGHNVGLTTDEFKEYNDVVSQMVELDDSIVSYWNEQGQAIIDVGNNLDETMEKYKKTIAYQANLALNGGETGDGPKAEDILDDLRNKIGPEGDLLTNRDTIEKVMKLLSSTDSKETMRAIEEMYNGSMALENAEIWDDLLEKLTEDNYEQKRGEVLAELKNRLNSVNSEIDSIMQEGNEILQSFANRDYDFLDLEAEQQNTVKKILGNIDTEQYNKLFTEDSSDEAVEGWVNKIVDTIKDNKDNVNEAFSELFSLDLSALDVPEAQQTIHEFINQIVEATGLDSGFWISFFHLDEFFNSTIPTYNRAVDIGESRGLGSREEIQEAMSKNGINSTDELATWIDVLNVANSLPDAIKAYTAALAESKPTLTSFEDAWNQIEEDDEAKKDSLENAKAELIELGKAGKLTAKALENNDFGAYLIEKCGIEAEEAAIRVNNLVAEIQRIGEMQNVIEAITDATDEKKINKSKRVNPKTLKELYDKLDVSKWDKEQQKAWKNYENVARKKSSTLNQLKDAQNKLATAYFNTNKYLTTLTKNTSKAEKNRISEELRQAGVKNPDEVVEQQVEYNTYKLASAKFESAAASDELANKTEDEVQALSDEMLATGATKEELGTYMVALVAAGSVSLSTEGSISNLMLLVEKLGYTSEQAQKFANYMKSLSNYIDSNGTAGFTNADGSQYWIPDSSASKGHANMLGTLARDALGSDDDIPEPPDYEAYKPSQDDKDKGGKGGGSKSDKQQKKTKQFIDWIERRITRINNIISKISTHIENIGKWNLKMKGSKVIGQYDAKTTKQQEEYIKKRNAERDKEIKFYKRLYNVQTVAYKKYLNKAESVDKAATRKKTKNHSAGAFSGKKGKAEWNTIVERITSGNYKKGDFKKQTWYQQLSEKKKNVVDKYIDWYDKAQSSRQAREEASSAARQVKIDKRSEWQTYYDNLQSLAEANEQIASGYKKQNKQVDIQIDYLKASYEQQIAIAKLNGDIVEAKRLAAEEEQKIRELAYHELENIYEDYERDIAVNNRNIQNADNMFQVVNAQGKYANAGWYQSKILNEYEIIQKAIEWRDAEIQKMNDEYYNGTLRKQDYEKAINDILTNFSSQAATSYSNIADNLTAIRDLEDSLYDEVRAQNSKQYERAQFLASLSREGNLNTKDKDKNYYGLTGTGKLNLSVGQVGIVTAEENMRTSAEQLAKVKELEKEIEGMDVATATKYLEDMQKKDPSKYLYSSYKQLKEADDKYTNQYIENVKARQEAENTLIEIMKEYYEGQKTYLGELIDARKKMLDQEKDLYDYSKNINEKTKNLATLQKRMAALSGDNSEEGKARRQKLQTELDQAQQDLQDTEYERWKSDQESMLDHLAEQYNDIIDKHLQDTDGLIKEAKDIVKDNQPEIKDKTQQILNNLTDTLPSNLANAVKDSFSTTTTTLTSDISSIKNALTSETGYLYQILEAIPKSIEDADENPNNNGGAGEDIPSDVKTSEPPPPSSSKNNAGGTASTDSETRNSEYALYNLLKKYGSKAKKKSASEYKSALNQKLFEFSNRFTGGKDIRILEDDEAAWLMYVEGLHGKTTFDRSTAFKESGQIYQILKNLYKIPGFKKGGIGQLVKANGEDGLAMVRNGEGFVAPEHVQSIQQLLNVVPDMTQLANATKNMNNQTTIETLALELPNVQDVPSFVNEFQNNKDVQRIFKIAVEDLVKDGSYSNKIYSV